MKPFLVETIGLVLRFLNRLSPFEYVLRRFSNLNKESTGALTEIWVLSHLLIAFLFLVLLPSSSLYILRWVVMTYAGVRMLEVVSFQAYTQLYGGYRNKTPRLHYLLLSYRRSIFLAVILYLEIIIWFAMLYRLNTAAFVTKGIALSDPLKALYYSTVTMTTIGYGDVYAQSRTGFLLVTSQALIAIFMTVLIFARIVTYIPRPATADPIECETPCRAPCEPQRRTTMAILAISTGIGITKQMYESLRPEVNWEGEPAPGGLLHVCAFDDAGDLHVADVWESVEAMNEFVHTRLAPGMQKLGIPVPSVSVFPVHNVNVYLAAKKYLLT